MEKIKHLIGLFIAILFALTPLQAAHIIGGEMTYECLGNNDYRITIKLYRDAAGGGAEFDGSPGNPSMIDATVTIYNNGNLFAIVNGGVPQESPIDPSTTNPCLIIPPNVSVEEGVYQFVVNLPTSPNTYTVSYQRCCRNNTISNLVNPGDAGATYTIDITPTAQSFCNSSPAFNSLPPIIICAGSDINFDFSATDPDGDLLIYELCAPFDGGGPNTTDAESAFGVAPNPDLPPPYSNISFSALYSALDPMGGDPIITIDAGTGLISGVPITLGQFVVGVCVYEYRNGELLSTVRRDFQFNVAECEPTVVADIQEDDIVNGEAFRIISCGESTIDFVNESFQEQFIETYYWKFGINGIDQTFNDWNPSINFPEAGIYNGILVINEGTTCVDTAEIIVEIYPDIVTDFEYVYDTCVYGPVDFTDLSFSNAGPDEITDWLWDFGDGQTSTEQNPSHLYQIPGNHPVSLTITDSNGCIETYIEIIEYFPIPPLLIISPSTYDGCVPAEIFFNNLSVPIDETYDIVWDFGDGGMDDIVSPTHTYTEPGTYTVSLEVTSPIGCYIDTVFNDLIRVRPSPQAGFSYNPETPNNFEPTVTFTDESTGADSFVWNFDNGVYTTILQNPVYTFPDTGQHIIQQVVIHPSGCTDTAMVVIDVEPQVRYFLPNAFTPNYDGINDEFRGNGVMAGAKDFTFTIWNRWGERVFETSDPFEAWNGQKNNSGIEAPSGVYVVVVRYLNPRNELIELNGFATLIR